MSMASISGARCRAVAVLVPLLLAACASGAPSPHTTITGDARVLRDAFNADTGKVRAIFLASPT